MAPGSARFAHALDLRHHPPPLARAALGGVLRDCAGGGGGGGGDSEAAARWRHDPSHDLTIIAGGGVSGGAVIEALRAMLARAPFGGPGAEAADAVGLDAALVVEQGRDGLMRLPAAALTAWADALPKRRAE